MRVAKMVMNGENALLGGACKKFRVNALVYPVSMNSSKHSLDVYITILLFGADKPKRDFYRYLKSHPRIRGIERKGDFIIGRIKESGMVKPMYKYSILHLEPIQIDQDGKEIWTVGSFDEEAIDNFVSKMEKLFKSKLLKLQSKNEPSISILTVYPRLTTLQKRAMDTAIKEGYYEYPRKIELKDLADSMDISYSTYHAHLRKAERKIIPFLFGKSS